MDPSVHPGERQAASLGHGGAGDRAISDPAGGGRLRFCVDPESGVRPLLGWSLAACASAKPSPVFSPPHIGRCVCSAAASSTHPKLLALSSVGLAVMPAQSLKHGAAQAPNSSFK